MHPEIENLIGFAIADGQITEKERNVILRKATELGGKSTQIDPLNPFQTDPLNPAEIDPLKIG